MLSNWISKGTQIISSGAKTISQVSQSTPHADNIAMTKQILSKIEIKLSKQLGQNLSGPLQPITAQIIKQTQLQKSLIEIKQKYNNLVSQNEVQTTYLKQMMQHFMDVFKNVGKSLKNDDMFTPLKDIQTAFYAYNVGKVQKQLKYFSKLYEAALEDYLKTRLNNKEGQKKDEIALFKTLNKNLEVELLKSRNNCIDLEKRLNQVHCKNQELTDKVSILQKLGAESSLLASNKERQKFIERQSELLDKIKVLEKQKLKLERINRQSDIQVVKVNSALQVLKANQQNVVEQLKREISKKQSACDALLARVRTEKLSLEEKVKTLGEELNSTKEQLLQAKKRQTFSKKDPQSADIKQLTQRNKQLLEKVEELKGQVQKLVSKDIMKSLFLSFEDQSKQWTVRKDIKNQIYHLLGIPQKIEKVEDRKWFGLF